jgi:hypothetical protein
MRIIFGLSKDVMKLLLLRMMRFLGQFLRTNSSLNFSSYVSVYLDIV